MRARTSWPRSSVPKGWPHDGPASCALKSMSLIGTCQISGPKATASIISARTTALATARRCRRNRRHVSWASETCLARLTLPSPASTVGDARVEPAIEDVCNQVEQDDQTGEHERHRHDHRRVVGQDGADQQRSDAGDAKDLFGDDGAAENRRYLQRDEGHNRDQRVADDMLDDDDALGEPLCAGSGDMVETDHVENRGTHIARPRRALEEA